jgi:hypothetical protein
MNFLPNKKQYVLLVIFEVASLALYLKGLITIHAFYVSGLSSLITLIILAHVGKFPFIAKGKIGSKLAYFASGLIPLWSINLLANSFVYPFWYPTQHRFWCFLPIIILGIINIRLSAMTTTQPEK